MTIEPLHELILEFIEKTNKPIFLTGKAGTGKTTFLRHIRSTTTKNMAVVAPTAVAAINAGGVTIHSFFQVPFGPIAPPYPQDSLFQEFAGKNFGSEKAKLIQCLELLIIDEISMVRADTLDYIDRVLRFVKGNRRPFGGVQLLMIGDLYQLPPVFQNDWHLLGKFYKSPYFFDSLAFSQQAPLTFELATVHRQSEPTFLAILNEIRNGAISETLLRQLNEHYQPTMNAEDLVDYVTLTTHNPLVKKINEERLSKLLGDQHIFKAQVTGDFPREAFPTEEELILKAGAMVMFIKNDSSGKQQFYNGRTATIDSIDPTGIRLTFLDDGSTFEAVQETWENTKYALSETEQKVTQTSAGSFTQFPLRLAWAITIHKSQGLTFDKAVIDVGAAFAHGQTYVALSRCRSLAGLVLREKVEAKNIITDPSVKTFMQKAQHGLPDHGMLANFVAGEELETIIDCFDFSPIDEAWNYFSNLLQALIPHKVPLYEKLNEIEQLLQKLNPIGQRFIQRELQPATNSFELRNWEGRLKKSAGYFLPHLGQLLDTIQALHQQLSGTAFHADYFPTLNQLLLLTTTKNHIFERLAQSTTTSAIHQVIKESALHPAGTPTCN